MLETETNFVIRNVRFKNSDVDLFFDDEEVNVVMDPNWDMFDLLVFAGIFKSKSQARKNWNRTGAEIPNGFSDFKNIGKGKKRITILNVV